MTTQKERFEVLARMERYGIAYEDRDTLRRIALTLHRWHELECGVEGSWYVERETEDATSPPHMKHADTGKDYGRIPDREAGALKRLKAIMAKYNRRFVAYVQGDPRGASLYLVPRKIAKGRDIDRIYSQGLAIY